MTLQLFTQLYISTLHSVDREYTKSEQETITELLNSEARVSGKLKHKPKWRQANEIFTPGVGMESILSGNTNPQVLMAYVRFYYREN